MPIPSIYQVHVEDVGTVYATDSENDARRMFVYYSNFSRDGVGRSSNKLVTLYAHNKPVRTFSPSLTAS